MKSEIRIRRTEPEDAEVIGYHRARMFQDMGEIPDALLDQFQKRSIERVRELLRSGEYLGWVAAPSDSPDKIVAGAGVQLRRVLPHPAGPTTIAEGLQGVIVNVFTEPEWRRQGVAAQLIRQIIHWSQEHRLDRLVLHASPDGRALYERLGFVLTDEMRFAGRLKQ